MLRAMAVALALAGCVSQGSSDVVEGDVSFRDQTYLVVSRGEDWFVRADGRIVPCRRATFDDCYWSLRAHLLARTTPDVIG